MSMKIPLNSKTLLFCWWVGSLLSVPLGAFLFTYREFWIIPLWFGPFYISAVLPSFFILPFWSVFAVGDQPFLKKLGLAVFAGSLVLVCFWWSMHQSL